MSGLTIWRVNNSVVAADSSSAVRIQNVLVSEWRSENYPDGLASFDETVIGGEFDENVELLDNLIGDRVGGVGGRRRLAFACRCPA